MDRDEELTTRSSIEPGLVRYVNLNNSTVPTTPLLAWHSHAHSNILGIHTSPTLKSRYALCIGRRVSLYLFLVGN